MPTDTVPDAAAGPACCDAGHDVVVATGAPFLDRLPVRTVPGLPAEVDLAWAEHEVRRRHPDLHGFEATLAMFGDVTAGATVTTMLEVLDTERADLLITEPLHLGAAVAGDLLDVPTLDFAIGLVPFMASTLHPVTVGYQRERWIERGLTPPDTKLLGQALLDPCPPSLQQPYDDAPRIPIRSVAWRGAAAALPRGWPPGAAAACLPHSRHRLVRCGRRPASRGVGDRHPRCRSARRRRSRR